MPITDKEILAYAQQLLSCTSETEIRACIGRSYYSAYHKSMSLADKLDVVLGSFDGGVHQKLISMFTTYHGTALIDDEKRKLRSIGYMMNQARTFRVDADYDLSKAVSSDDAMFTYQLVLKIGSQIDILAAQKGWDLTS